MRYLYKVFDNNGREVYKRSQPEPLVDMTDGDLTVTLCPDELFNVLCYLTGGVVHARQPIVLSHPSSALVNTDITITGLPNPCDVTWPDGEVTTVTDGEVVFNVDLEGQYTFKFDSIPYIIEDVTVEAITPT